MRPDDRLGGHLVSGHVDGVGRVLRDRPTMRARSAGRFAAPAPLLRYIAQKGSICVDGVSLTVNAVDDARLRGRAGAAHASRIPPSPARTVGDAVNLEVDLVARYVERLLTTRQDAPHELRHRSPNCSTKSAPAAWS